MAGLVPAIHDFGSAGHRHPHLFDDIETLPKHRRGVKDNIPISFL